MANKDKNKYNTYMNKYLKKRYYSRRAQAISQLGGHCTDCGSTENLEFDHVDPSTKNFVIGRALCSVSEQKLQEELTKCVLRCTSCHRKRGIQEGHIRPKASHGTHAMYRHHKCRCDACKEANSRVQRDYKRRRRQKTLNK